MKTDADLIIAGQSAAAEALRLWHLDVGDPAPQFLADPTDAQRADAKWMTLHERALRWRTVIDDILTCTDWAGYTPYKGNHEGPEWCGVTARRCWEALKRRWNASWFGSTARLYHWGHYLPNPVSGEANPPPVETPRRLVAKLGPTSTVADLPFTPRAGDIFVIGGPHDSPKLKLYGRHILVGTGVDLERGIIHTVSGNGAGNGPDGQHREGIVVADVHIGGTGDHVKWIYRPAPGDLELVVG